jgi:hypothetical protein
VGQYVDMLGWRKVAAVLAVSLVASGCAASGGRQDAAVGVATRLLTAVGDGDGDSACALLAPSAAAAVAESEGRSCAAAILQEDLPGPGDVRDVDIYGRQARVVLASDTLFLAAFKRGWLVTAAGCQPRPPQRYDCMVQGG